MDSAPGAISMKQFLTPQLQAARDPVDLFEEEAQACYIGDELGVTDAERVQPLGGCGPYADLGWPELETNALSPPIEIEVDLPPPGLWGPGQALHCAGPHGPVSLQLPAHASPGERLCFKLAPRPEYRVEVPPDVHAGCIVRFQKENGEELRVAVPKGLDPGDTFEVSPPSVMVRVPEAAQPGDIVKFASPSHSCQEAYRARVPEGVPPCAYFTARLPATTKLCQAHM